MIILSFIGMLSASLSTSASLYPRKITKLLFQIQIFNISPNKKQFKFYVRKFCELLFYHYLCGYLICMEISFDKDYLKELYFNGKCSDKKHRYQPQIVKRYIRVVDVLSAVATVEELFPYNSLNYEVLAGDKKGIESVRVNDQYRLEFSSKREQDKNIVTICNILELTNHYK